ncbi:MAG TPA: AAA family ATPase, partial [Nitrososphaera sp.]|nr:AAA family ATPase [Nitrososphaera sp.]
NLFSQYTRPLNVEGSLKVDELGKITDGYSASDIKDICQSVQLRVVNELFESGKAMEAGTNPRPIVAGDFREMLKIRKPSVSVDMIRAYMRWSDQFKAL